MSYEARIVSGFYRRGNRVPKDVEKLLNDGWQIVSTSTDILGMNTFTLQREAKFGGASPKVDRKRWWQTDTSCKHLHCTSVVEGNKTTRTCTACGEVAGVSFG